MTDRYFFPGLVSLGRSFRRLDENGAKKLNLEEFTIGLRNTGLEIDDCEAEEIFANFDEDRSGSINMTDFLIGIRVGS